MSLSHSCSYCLHILCDVSLGGMGEMNISETVHLDSCISHRILKKFGKTFTNFSVILVLSSIFCVCVCVRACVCVCVFPEPDNFMGSSN